MRDCILIAAQNYTICGMLSGCVADEDIDVEVTTTATEIRSMDTDKYDVIVISTPLSDEFGLELIAELNRKTKSGLIVLVGNEKVADVRAKIAFTGACVLSRPLSKSEISEAIKEIKYRRSLAASGYVPPSPPKKDMVQRAKLCLMEYLKFSEEQAHRHIQKRAMDTRQTQQAVAEEILQLYLNRI